MHKQTDRALPFLFSSGHCHSVPAGQGTAGRAGGGVPEGGGRGAGRGGGQGAARGHVLVLVS